MPVWVRQNFARRPPQRVITVTGADGSVTVDLFGARIVADSTAIVPPPAVPHPRNDMFLEEARHFLACLSGREKPAVPLEEGVTVLRLAVAVKEAIKSGRSVEIKK